MTRRMPARRTTGASMGEGGFTIVELLVAVVILVFVSIALMQTAIVNIEFNTKNAIRDEGVRLAGETLDDMRNAALTSVITQYNNKTDIANRTVRNIVNMKYTVITNAVDVGLYNKKLDVTVKWQWKGEDFSTSMSTVR